MRKRNCSANKSARTVCCLLAVLLLLSGCTGRAEQKSSAANLTFTDDLGREVSLAETPKRVAALLGSFAEVWTLAGGSLSAAAADAWEDYDLPLENAVSLGGAHSPSVEALLAAEPDFVLASASTAADVELMGTLETAGIPVAYFDVDDFADYLRMLGVCTDLTGRKDLYEQNGVAVGKRIEEIKAEFAAADLPEEKKTVLLLRVSSGLIKAKGSSGTVLGEMLRDLGCVNIADSDETLLETLSVESVIRSEPYRIFVVTMGADTDAAIENLKRMTEENPAWGTLAAIAENRLYLMDKNLFNRKPNANWGTAYETLTEILLK